MKPLYNEKMTLAKWLGEEMKKHRLSQGALSKLSGFSQPYISQVLSGEYKPSADFCMKMAESLNEPPEKVLRLAGILPDAPNDPIIVETIELLRSMPENKRILVARLVKIIYHDQSE